MVQKVFDLVNFRRKKTTNILLHEINILSRNLFRLQPSIVIIKMNDTRVGMEEKEYWNNLVYSRNKDE